MFFWADGIFFSPKIYTYGVEAVSSVVDFYFIFFPKALDINSLRVKYPLNTLMHEFFFES